MFTKQKSLAENFAKIFVAPIFRAFSYFYKEQLSNCICPLVLKPLQLY
ncbi:hypothetical protein MNBD_ALPHA11-1372 [hydrothermal vent metagenome]|uniref:Uncharacterized protein n=1 Tax=hydrothermal vent metagenome TaxID=652676 RepID=A0A3B0TW98_9ZZZZ